MSMKKIHGIFHGIPWNCYMEFSWNSMEFHEFEVDGIPWNFVNSWNFMKFGFDRVVAKSSHFNSSQVLSRFETCS
jgi:hypothetical protein